MLAQSIGDSFMMDDGQRLAFANIITLNWGDNGDCPNCGPAWFAVSKIAAVYCHRCCSCGYGVPVHMGQREAGEGWGG